MSVCLITVVALPMGANLLSGAVFAAVTAAAATLNLVMTDESVKDKAKIEQGNTVDLHLENTEEVVGNLSVGQSLTFVGEGVKVVFYQDAEGRTSVRVSGNKSKAELREIGETLAQKLIQQYAYHRLVTEMKARNMNIVEEEVEHDGTVRMRVRVFQNE